ncbi:MAG: hypothetical protein ABI884_14075 [Gemmatimonadota bacterium]
MTFTAVGHDRFNNLVSISSPIWAVINGIPRSITTGGVYTPASNYFGQGHWLNSISATADGHTGLGDVTVTCPASCS